MGGKAILKMEAVRVLIEVAHLSVVYPDGHPALRDVSFTLADGERTALVGANGAGKSTLLLALVGILSATEGSIVADGIRAQKHTVAQIRSRVGMVFQNPDDQLFMARVYDDVAFGPRNFGLDEAQTAQRVREALKTLHIEHLAQRFSGNLSGGEKRAVALATVLAMHPGTLLLDEPSSFLDPRARRTLIEALAALPQTQLIATHDLELAARLCPRVLVLQEGCLCAQGNASEILSDAARMEQCGL